MGSERANHTDLAAAAATGNPRSPAINSPRTLPPCRVLGSRVDWVEVAAWAALAVVLVSVLAAVAVCRASRGLLFGGGRAAKEASVTEQSRFQIPEAVERPPEVQTSDVPPEEFARLAALAGWEARTIRLFLTARVPGMPLVIPAGPFVVAGRSYRIVTPK